MPTPEPPRLRRVVGGATSRATNIGGTLLATALLWSAACAASEDPAGAPATEVVDVVDGDTVDVATGGGEVERVRLIGINAPESGECFADEAESALVSLVEGAAVTLVADTTDRDRFGRLLRYVEVDGIDVGRVLVEQGRAIARRYPPDTARSSGYEDAQADARAASAGLWAPDACGAAAPSTGELRFSAIRFDADGPDAENLNDEWVAIENTGDRAVDLSGWGVRDESSSNRYSFPDGFVLDAGTTVTLRSGCGADTRFELHWCRSGSAVWNNDGDTAFLTDPSGNVVATRAG